MLNAGVAGVGFIGRVHIEALRRLGNVRVAALSDPVQARRKADELHVEYAFSDYREMLDRVALDAVHICTPNALHAEVARYALQKGVHVICEKPLTGEAESAAALARTFEGSGLICAVNYHNRFYPMAAQMREMIRGGEAGRILSVTGSYLQDWMSRPQDCNWRVSGATRAVSDIGVHLLDLAEYVTGQRIRRVMADFGIAYPERLRAGGSETFGASAPGQGERVPVATEDMASILFRLEDGALGSVFLSQVFAGKTNCMEIRVCGDKKSLSWSLEDPDSLFVGERDRPAQIYHKDAAYLKDRAGSLTAYPPGHMEGFCDAIKQHFAAIYAAIENPGRSYAGFGDGARSERICAKLLESHQQQHWLEI